MTHLIYITTGIMIGGLIWLVSIPPRGHPIPLLPPPTPGPLLVHVAGSIAHPGVYELEKGARVQDAVEAAGGFLADSDVDRINLAERLEDGQQVLIGQLEQDAASISPEKNTSSGSGNLVNINTASSSELQQLPGIGPTIAQRIIDYRVQNGAFTDTIGIVNVSGIGPATYNKIKDLITTR